MILAQAIAAAPPPRYEFSTLGPWVDQPLAPWVAAAVGLLLAAVVALTYWRERATLSPAAMLPLLLLRVGALVAVVLYGLAPEKRDAREEMQPSRVVVLVDDSLSMALAESTEASAAAERTRGEAALALLESGLIGELRNKNEVQVAATSDARGGQVYPLAGGPAATAEQDNGPPPLSIELFSPRAAESRLGDAIEQALAALAGGPMSGVVLASDGQNNAGASPELVAAAAGEAGVPVFTIGLGSESAAKNLAVRDLVAPRRAYPKDEIQLTAVIEQQGYDSADGSAALYVRQKAADPSSAQLLETKPIAGLKAGEQISLAFTVRPEQAGEYVYRVVAAPLPGEHDPQDNEASAEVQVVDRLLRVLIVAGGPTRDYHFLRDQLRRDDSFSADVWLQSAEPNTVQDADSVLTEFPTDPQELAAYDLFVALDADWTAVPPSASRALAECVSERGAGFLFAAGPVQTPRWLRENDPQGVVTLLPVKPAATPLLLAPTERSSPTPSRVELTRAGEESSPLWVLGDQQASVAFWEEDFPGFYTTAQVETIKPGAVVYAEAAASADAAGGAPRVVFAEQFFGAGRSFYIGAPEIWRLRTQSPAAMRAFYTKLLQHLAQGRLLADSPAGSLLFERDRYNVGETITLRATLTDDAAAAAPQARGLVAQVELPGGRVQNLPLAAAEGSTTIWTADLRAESEGAYTATLQLPSVTEPLTAKAVVSVPALERSRTQRNTQLLEQIAQASGGRYYATIDSVTRGAEGLPPLADLLVSRSESVVLYGAPDEEFARQVARWLLGVIAGCLLLEWVCRRALSLA